MEISVLPVSAASKNHAWHFAGRELMQGASCGCQLQISPTQLAAEVSGPMHVLFLSLACECIYYIRILFALGDLLFEVVRELCETIRKENARGRFAIRTLGNLQRSLGVRGFLPAVGMTGGVVIRVVVANGRRRWLERRWRRFLRGEWLGLGSRISSRIG